MALFDDLPESAKIVLKHEFNLSGPIPLALRNKKNSEDPQWAAIQARMSELLAMSDWDRAGVAGQIKHAENEKERKRKELWEASRFYNARDSRPDVERWSRAASLTTEEAVALSFDREPSLVNSASLEEFRNVSPFVQEYFKRLDLMKRSVDAGELPSPIPSADFVSWANRMGYKLPEKLKERLAEQTARSAAHRKPSVPASMVGSLAIWAAMPELKVWEACALSLGIDPGKMKHEPNAWMSGPGSGPFFLATSFPTKAVQDEFEGRMRLALAWYSKPPYFTAHPLNERVPGNSQVSLIEFVRWGEAVGLTMPPDFLGAVFKTADSLGKLSQSAGRDAPQQEAHVEAPETSKGRRIIRKSFRDSLQRADPLRSELAEIMDRMDRDGSDPTNVASVIGQIKPSVQGGGVIIAIDEEGLTYNKRLHAAEPTTISIKTLRERIEGILQSFSAQQE